MKKIFSRAKQFIAYIAALRVPIYASHAGFFIILAMFPALVLLMSLLRYTGMEVRNLTELLQGVIPEALLPSAKRLIITTYQSTSGTIVSVSALTALWSAGRGVQGLSTGLNSIYGVEESRGYFHTRLMSVLYTVLFLLVLLLTLILHVFGTSLLSWFSAAQGALFGFLEGVVDLRFFLLLAVQTALFAAIFMFLPNKHNKFIDSLPGALFASGGWLIFSDIYSIYVEKFAGLSNIYGSVYAVALSMLWLYICVSLVFYGGALNCWLADNK